MLFLTHLKLCCKFCLHLITISLVHKLFTIDGSNIDTLKYNFKKQRFFNAVHKTLNLNTFTWKRKCWMNFTFFSCNLDIIHRHTDVCIVRARAYKCYLQEGISSLEY